MNPVSNPYAPGAGFSPPELAGREEILEAMRVSLERTRTGRPAKSIVMVGLRGVGKTVLLNRICAGAEASGMHSRLIEVPGDRSLPAILVPWLHLVLLKLSKKAAAKQLAIHALKALAGFVRAMKVKYQDIEVGLDVEPEPGLADSEDLESGLQALFQVVGETARADESCVAILLDELQYVKKNELTALIMALHHVAQRQFPVMMVGAGLPQVRRHMGEAKSYAERLFDFPGIGPLSTDEAKLAIAKPAQDEDVEIETPALDAIVSRTQGYPYFLQEWGKQVWDVAEDSPITIADVNTASEQIIASLDESFFQVRFDRLTPREKVYLRAMAKLGAEAHRSGEIARELNRSTSSLGPLRAQLINKGMIWSPGHGETAFTVPMFDEFMLRIMPGEDWRRD